MTPWRVATYNIRHGLGRDGRVDLTRTAREIRALGADVIGLQEVDVAFGERSAHADQAAELGELLGMSARFGAALDLPPAREGGARRRYGIALLSAHEILASHRHLLPAHPGRAAPTEPRAVLRTRLRRRDGEELDVLVTHLDNASRAHRTAQVQGIVDLAHHLTGPAVLMGDMNADLRAPELAALAATGWRDAARAPSVHAPFFRALPFPLPGARATHPARLPLRRIDAVWVRGGLEVSSLEVGPCAASDHRPVVAALRTARM